MALKDFKCKQCGNCCLNLSDAFTTCAFEEDIQLWEREGREDILAWVYPIQLGSECVYDLWINPETGEDAERCPWLKKLPKNKYICKIHDVKPKHCRDYPKSKKHAEDTDCKRFRR